MARGRMLNRKISVDKDMAIVESEVGPYGVIVFTWLIAHLDREGRFSGDPEVIRGGVVPRLRGATSELVAKTLAVCDKIGLIDWYEADGDQYVSYPRFHRNQKGMRVSREPESDIPPPPECHQRGASVAPAWRQDATSVDPEGKGREGNKREGKEKKQTEQSDDPPFGDDDDPPPTKKKDLEAQVQEVWAHYRTSHPRSAAVLRPKKGRGACAHRAVVARLTDGHTVHDIKLAIDGYHRSDWHTGRDPKTNGTTHLGLELICRTEDKLLRGIEMAEKPKQSAGRAHPPEYRAPWRDDDEVKNP
jgi:hypothetical protein